MTRREKGGKKKKILNEREKERKVVESFRHDSISGRFNYQVLLLAWLDETKRERKGDATTLVEFIISERWARSTLEATREFFSFSDFRLKESLETRLEVKLNTERRRTHRGVTCITGGGGGNGGGGNGGGGVRRRRRRKEKSCLAGFLLSGCWAFRVAASLSKFPGDGRALLLWGYRVESLWHWASIFFFSSDFCYVGWH